VLPYVVITAIALALLLAAEVKAPRTAAVMKLAASTTFVAAAIARGATETTYGRILLAAFVLSWFGDTFLISKRSAAFLAGLGSFLLAHVCFATAFVLRGIDDRYSSVAILVVLVAAVYVVRWLRPYVPAKMRIPVLSYILTIAVMVTLAWGTLRSLVIPLGATLFFASDLAVARERFVAPSLWNQRWGLPLYYAAQLLLVASIPA
jgi:uncharacterized membrane protein YhhN